MGQTLMLCNRLEAQEKWRKTDLQPNTPLKAEWLLFHVVRKCVTLCLGGATCRKSYKFYLLYKYKMLRCFAHLDSITGPPLSCLCVFSDPSTSACAVYPVFVGMIRHYGLYTTMYRLTNTACIRDTRAACFSGISLYNVTFKCHTASAHSMQNGTFFPHSL